ncbi:MAG: hypothetical protein WC539_01950 [Nitrospirota bacterium]
MIQNKIVVHYQDGKILKGFTSDFMPTKNILHLAPVDAEPNSKPLSVMIQNLKAVFFVKDFVGNPAYHEKKEFEPSKTLVGRKIRVVFKDNEVLVGTTQGYQPGRPGFFVFPLDPQSNNDRCYVVSPCTKTVTFM